MQRPVANQVADIGGHPMIAGLDELVVVELLDILFERLELRRDQRDQRAQRVALLLVANAVDRGQQRIQALGVEGAHGISSNRSNGPASSVNNSAGNAAPPLARMRDASRRVWRDCGV